MCRIIMRYGSLCAINDSKRTNIGSTLRNFIKPLKPGDFNKSKISRGSRYKLTELYGLNITLFYRELAGF